MLASFDPAVFHHEEQFLDSGNIHGSSATSAIGRPNLESWDLFTRETLQNSWDARDRTSDEDGVTFSIDYRCLTSDAASGLKNFFAARTEGLESLQAYLDSDTGQGLPVLLVSDSGTTGLQGPTSAAVSCEGRDDFVSFVRNIGRRQEKEMRGGTYGFGKGVFFNMSDCQTVLIYSRTRNEKGVPVSRFIAMANSNGYTRDSQNFTGRHWWGEQATGNNGVHYANPFEGYEADKLAQRFYMDQNFTTERHTGTTVAVLNPRILDTEVDEVMGKIAKALTKWAWPHMVDQIEGMDPIDFRVSVDGTEIEVPNPRRDPLLKNFVSAYEYAISEPEHHDTKTLVREVQSKAQLKRIDVAVISPAEFLGRFAIRETTAGLIPHHSVLDEDTTNHVALMRGPRMVVNYWPGPRTSPEDSYAGVFIASSQLDELFAASEPPAHDEWNYDTVNLNDKRFFRIGKRRRSHPVRIVFRRLQEVLKGRASGNVESDASEAITVLGTVANSLGAVMPSGAGTSTRSVKANRPAKRTSTTTTKSGIKKSITYEGLKETSFGVVAVYLAEIEARKPASFNTVDVEVKTAVLVDGKRQTVAKDGLEMATPLGWLYDPDDQQELEALASRSETLKDLRITVETSKWQSYCAVLLPKNTAVTAELEVVENTEGTPDGGN